ncbi:MAG: peptidoglycan DD-metalloendopeptidase family protein [Deltaproteobacteria bacterium]|nr:peptidoglycan DD-metalloendopeptidase family protein [Deltaproteobacteria bacterium]
MHKAADINYQGFGQTGINRKHPEVGSPVSGTITDINPRFGIIEVKDTQGYRHRIWHLNAWDKTFVKDKSQVIAGQYIGDMGGRGPNGAKQYDQHVHYEVITQPDPNVRGDLGDFIDPEAFWNSRLYYELNAGRLNHVPLEPASLLD